MRLNFWWGMVKKAGAHFSQKSAFFHAAALSYYALFSLIPMIYLSVISFGIFVGKERCSQMITELFQQNMGITDVHVFTDYITAPLKLQYPVSKFNEFKPRFKSPKNRFSFRAKN